MGALFRHISTGLRATNAKGKQECDRFSVRRGANTPLGTLPHFPAELTHNWELVAGGVPVVRPLNSPDLRFLCGVG
jgi:hypothetical protein